MKKIFMCPTGATGTVWYRMVQTAQYINRNRIAEVAIPALEEKHRGLPRWEFPEHFSKQTEEIFYNIMINVDAAIFQAVHTKFAIAVLYALKEKYKKPIYMDVDDHPFAIMSNHPSHKNIGPGTPIEWVAHKQAEMSDGIITSTKYLAKVLKQYNRPVYVIPNGIDFSFWEGLKKKRSKNGNVTIGWIGAGGHDHDLKVMKKVIPVILKKYKNARFCFVYGAYDLWKKFKNNPKVKFVIKWKPIAEYPQFIASQGFDVGLAPLTDSAFNRAKSNLRWLEYSALKIPTVASCVEPYRDTIDDGETGLLARTADDWIKHLSNFIEDKQHRQKIGNAAYDKLKGTWSIKHISQMYIETLYKNGSEAL